MSKSTRRRPALAKNRPFLQKPNGRFTARVQAVGPDHFAIVSIDPAKSSSCFMLSSFYGDVLINPTYVNHTRGEFRAAIDRIRLALDQHQIRDCIVAIERTGNYHRPVQRAFRDADFDTRLVHPYATKQFRQPADPGNKTEPTDLAAIFRVALNGFAVTDPDWPDVYVKLQMLRRHRHNLIEKRAALQNQIQEHMHAAMPGFAKIFCKLWDSPAALAIARVAGSASVIRRAGIDGLKDILENANVHALSRTLSHTLPKIVAWAEQAPNGHPHSDYLADIISCLDDDRLQKTKEIREVEQRLAGLVAETPHVLLLAMPGINIVSAADFAGEAGPMNLYPNANHLTGRAALMPSRYQSDKTDRADGPLRRMGNRKLRAVLLQCADNLIRHNHHFGAKANLWKRQDKNIRWIHVKVAKSFSRVAYAMIVGRQLFDHPSCRERHYILDKILKFHVEHRSSNAQLETDLNAAAAQLPRRVIAEEAQTLQQRLDELNRKRGVQPLANILPLVLAKLTSRQVQSENERQPDPS